MAYLPCAMVYVPQYMYFGFAKSVSLGDTACGVLWVSGSSSSGTGRGGWLSGRAWPGLCSGLRAEGPWRAGPRG